MTIHPTAIVHPEAQLDPTVTVGPYAVIGPNVRVGRGTSVGPHAVIEGDTTIGEDNRIFQFASLGAAPQDLKYAGEPTRLVIGNRNAIREFATLHLGTAQGRGETTIGDDCLFMAGSHVAHDCVVGNHVIL
ncbi:MAG: acyl-[acyl-carrier-protein]-UDP-N-acetylglucosamine O-acyltransferase, partial [Pseudomonadota bacterium]